MFWNTHANKAHAQTPQFQALRLGHDGNLVSSLDKYLDPETLAAVIFEVISRARNICADHLNFPSYQRQRF